MPIIMANCLKIIVIYVFEKYMYININITMYL